jgi:hypothetical protein
MLEQNAIVSSSSAALRSTKQDAVRPYQKPTQAHREPRGGCTLTYRGVFERALLREKAVHEPVSKADGARRTHAVRSFCATLCGAKPSLFQAQMRAVHHRHARLRALPAEEPDGRREQTPLVIEPPVLHRSAACPAAGHARCGRSRLTLLSLGCPEPPPRTSRLQMTNARDRWRSSWTTVR